MSQLQYWVWLSMRFGVRPKMKLALVEHFGTPRDVYFATEADYRVRVPLRPEELRLLLENVEPDPAPVHLLYTARDLAPLKLRKFIDFAAPALRQALLRIAGAA